MFVIVKAGVYRHDLFGIFDNLEKAQEAAVHLAKTCIDDYHSYDVVPLPLNTLCTVSKNSYGNVVYGNMPVFSARKSDCESGFTETA